MPAPTTSTFSRRTAALRFGIDSVGVLQLLWPSRASSSVRNFAVAVGNIGPGHGAHHLADGLRRRRRRHDDACRSEVGDRRSWRLRAS